jgi:hypothetical protein
LVVAAAAPFDIMLLRELVIHHLQLPLPLLSFVKQHAAESFEASLRGKSDR